MNDYIWLNSLGHMIPDEHADEHKECVGHLERYVKAGVIDRDFMKKDQATIIINSTVRENMAVECEKCDLGI